MPETRAAPGETERIPRGSASALSCARYGFRFEARNSSLALWVYTGEVGEWGFHAPPPALSLAAPSCSHRIRRGLRREAATWQTQEWPYGRCADPGARRTLPSRRALLFPSSTSSTVPGPHSLAAPTHHITSGGAAFSSSWRVCGILVSGYEGVPTRKGDEQESREQGLPHSGQKRA
jgi:hypothetical protein